MKKLLLGAIGVIIILGAGFFYSSFVSREKESNEEKEGKRMQERVTLTTTDGVTIVGDYAGTGGQPAVVMLHMMPATRASWRNFSDKLSRAGFQALAIDFRGHGQSQGGPEGYKNFSDSEHQASMRDVEAAVEFLKSREASAVFIVGASIGANLTLWYATEHSDVSAIILLSPGLDYRGIRTGPLVSKLKAHQKVYFVAAHDDVYSADTVETLYRQTSVSVKKDIRVFEKAGHGTTIFEREPEFMDELVTWLSATKEPKDK